MRASSGRSQASALYDALGAPQVAKPSYAGMRLLHRLEGRVPVWPMDPRPAAGSLGVEIYTRAFIRLASVPGRKKHTRGDLTGALKGLGSRVPRVSAEPTDHETDVLIAAAGMHDRG